jgi:membrane dipeptidase
MLYRLHDLGLRSIGPVWSRSTIFGHGVPFRYPSGPDIGPGLTEAGERLVKRCNELGILIDLSHMNEAGFRDVAKLSTAPLVATHSNAHAICPHARNLTDEQLRIIADSDGMVGLNFATAFLRPDGRMIPDVAFETMLRHLDHLIGILGETRVGLGSDYDGAVMPEALATAAGLPALQEAMRQHGYDDTLQRRLMCDNWLSALERIWH